MEGKEIRKVGSSKNELRDIHRKYGNEGINRDKITGN